MEEASARPDFAKARAFVDRYDWIAPFLAKGATLDCGCIDERHPERIANSLHARLKKLNPKTVGVDADAGAVAAVKKLGFDIQLADAQRSDLGGPYDAIFAGELIEHLDNPGLFLDNAKRHLAPSGLLLLTTPNPFAANQFAKILKHAQPQVHAAHRFWFSPETLAVLLESRGYAIADFAWIAASNGPLRRVLARWRRYWSPGFGIAARVIR